MGVCNKSEFPGYVFTREGTTNAYFPFEVAHLSFQQSEGDFSWQAQQGLSL